MGDEEKTTDAIVPEEEKITFPDRELIIHVTIGTGLLTALFFISRQNYLLFHGLAEFVSITVAWSVFMLVWNSRRFVESDALVFLGISYLFIGSIDLVHTFAYKGMGVFPGENASNYATQLWISARYLESISLLIFTLRVGKAIRLDFTFFTYAIVTAFILASIFIWSVFPVCYVDGVGLTVFKKNSEYFISLILLGTAFLLRQKKDHFDPTVFRLLFCVFLTTIISELAFTFYVSVYGLSNLVGHFMKLISFYLIYLSLIRSGLTRPYEILFRDYKARESELMDANARWSAFSQYSSPLTIFDSSGRYLAVNPSAAELLGRRESDIVGKKFADLLKPETHTSFQKMLMELVTKQKPVTVTDTIENREGIEKTFHSTLFPIKNTNPLCYGSIAIDITEQLFSEKKSIDSEQMFSKLFHHTPLMMTINSFEDDTYLDANESFTRMTGYRRESAIGSTPVDIGSITDDEQYRLKQKLLKSGGRVEGVEITIRKNNGELIRCLYWGEVFDIDGKRRLLSIANDITKQNQIESERKVTIDLLRLINAEHGLNELMQAVTLLLSEWSGCEAVGIRLRKDDDYPYFETRGFPPEFVLSESRLCNYDEKGELMRDSLGNPVLDCLCGLIISGATLSEQPCFTEGGSFWTNSTTDLLLSTGKSGLGVSLRNKCNREGYESVALIPLRFGTDTFGLIQLNDSKRGMFTSDKIELFERLRTNLSIALKERQEVQALHESEEKFRIVLKNSPVIVAMTDLELRYTWIHNSNPDFKPELVIGKRDTEIAQNEGAEKLLQLKKSVLETQKPKRAQIMFPRSVGFATYDIAAEPISDRNGMITGVATVALDVTEHKRTQEFMIQTEKMMSIGGMAAGIAHEINNPLAGILQNIQVVRNRLKDYMPKNTEVAQECGTSMDVISEYAEKRKVFQMIESIMESGKTARNIIDNLLSFSRKSSSQLLPIDICQLIDKTVELVRNDYDIQKKYDFRNIEIIREYDSTCPEIECDSVKIQQVFLNLLKNAAYAISDMDRPPNITLRVQQQSDSMIRIEVEDNGPGMDKAIAKHIFEPFFTTKDVGDGTGLGLSISYFIITENHGGTMLVESTPGKGANFIICLPVKFFGYKTDEKTN